MRQCLILIGGKGTRLGSITKSIPKPMLEINGNPFLLYILDMISRFGFNEIILLASHANEVISNYFHDLTYKGCDIKIIIEDEPLGTGGAIINAYQHLDETFFCLNGDSIIEGNWLSIIQNFDKTCDCFVALTRTTNPSRYGSVSLENEIITSFEEKDMNSQSGFINGGIYIFRKKIFEGYPKEYISLENTILPKLVDKGKVKGKYIDGYFLDIGTPSSLKEGLSRDWNKERKAVIFDRDGTLNEDEGYTFKTSDLIWKKGAIELIKHCNDRNYYVFVATNQSGIAKNKFKEADMHIFHNEMQNQLKKSGAHIDKFYFSPYHLDGILPEYKKDSEYRKPNTGMLQQIKDEWNLLTQNMIMIGDKKTDVECAKNFKIKGFLYNGVDNLFKNYAEKIFE
tara:strand:- start:649 stop:1839 length:1191 start_codon:yes stop_codon:yes gene_type:complete